MGRPDRCRLRERTLPAPSASKLLALGADLRALRANLLSLAALLLAFGSLLLMFVTGLLTVAPVRPLGGGGCQWRQCRRPNQ
jgi:hypothetical protein